MKIYPLDDITANGTPQQVSVTDQMCKWYQIQGRTVSAEARVGDSTITANRGGVIGQAGAQFSPPIAEPLNEYNLRDVYVLGTSGDIFAVLKAR